MYGQVNFQKKGHRLQLGGSMEREKQPYYVDRSITNLWGDVCALTGCWAHRNGLFKE